MIPIFADRNFAISCTFERKAPQPLSLINCKTLCTHHSQNEHFFKTLREENKQAPHPADELEQLWIEAGLHL